MKLEYIIALRYIITKRTLKFVSLISLISVVGLTIGVAALVVVLSVFNGFGSLVTSILVSFDPHLRIEQPTRSEATAYSVLENTLQANPNIAAFSPFVQGKALMVAKSTNRVVMIRGLLENKVNSVSGLQQSIVLGKLKFENARGNGIVLGLALADRMGAVVGDTLSIVSPSGAEMAATQLGLPLIRRVVVEGIYESNNKDYDSFFAFVSLKMAQSLFSVDGFIDGLDVRVRHADDAEKMALRLKEQFNSFRIQTWYDLHKELYSIMQIERWSAYVILTLIVAVASFNLLGSLTMTVIEKTRDIGILKSMGMSQSRIQKVFRLQGLMVGIVGTVLGLIIGVFIVYLQKQYHLFPLDPTVYIISAIPVELRWLDLVVIPLASIGLSILASRRPARRAAQLHPAEAIRWE